MPTLRLAIDARGARRGAAEFRTAARQVEGASTKAVDSAKRVIGGLVAGFGGFMVLKDATRVIETFETSLLTLEAVTRASAEQMASLQGEARSLGASTRYSAGQVADSMTMLARAGFTVDEILKSTATTLDLASAGQLELAESGDLLSNVMRQFNMEATQSNHIADVLVGIANRANTNVRQLGEGMKYVGPLAANLGISLEETAASMGALGDAGIQGSMAGTNLRGVLSALIGPTDAAAAALEDMGVKNAAAMLQSDGLAATMRKLGDAHLDATKAVQIFGRRNATAALILAGSTDRVDELNETLQTLDGEASDVAKKMSSGLGGAFKTLRSTVEEAYLRIGDAGLTGGLKSLIDVGTETVRILFGMDNGGKEWSATAQILAQVLRGVGIWLGVIVATKAVGFFFSMAKGLATAALNAGKLALGLSAALALIGAAFAGWELGSWLNDNFRVAEEAGQAFAYGLLKVWEDVKFGAKAAGAFVEWVWDNALSAIQSAFAAIQNKYADWAAVAYNLGIISEDTYSSISTAAYDAAAGVEAANKKLGDSMDALVEEKNTAIAALDEARGKATLALDEKYGSKDPLATNPNGKTFGEFVLSDLDKIKGPVKDALGKISGLWDSYFSIGDYTPPATPEGAPAQDAAARAAAALGSSAAADVAKVTESAAGDAKGAIDETTDAAKTLNDVGQDAARGLARGLVDVARGAERAGDMVLRLVDNLASNALQNFLESAIFGGGSSGGGGLGGLFGKLFGSGERNAQGTVFDRPTFFFDSSGRRGVVGEAGKEILRPASTDMQRGGTPQPRPVRVVNVLNPSDILLRAMEQDPNVVMNYVHRDLARRGDGWRLARGRR